MKPVKLALCQMRVGPDVDGNLADAGRMLRQAAAARADIAVLPEMFTCPYRQEGFAGYAQALGGVMPGFLRQAARDGGFHLIAGSFPEQAADGSIFNACYVLDPSGEVLAVHRKIHLFDVELSEGISFQESAALQGGSEPTLVDLAGVRTGIGICYDLRFPEYARILALAGAQLLVYPGAFNPVTGPAHWELLLRARAVDNQVFTAGVSPAPHSELSYQAYGHSTMVDPWGRLIAAAGVEESLVLIDLDRAVMEKVRRELPVLKHRRTDLYRVQGLGQWAGWGDKAN